jgi:hypothetical protein
MTDYFMAYRQTRFCRPSLATRRYARGAGLGLLAGALLGLPLLAACLVFVAELPR